MAPLPFIIHVFFVLHHAYSPHASTHFVGSCHLLSWKNQAMRPKRMHCWCVWIGMVHWKPPNIVVMSHLERHHCVGMRGLATAAPNKKKLSSRHEVRGVCFWWFVLVFFVDFPSSIDKCWPQGKIKIHCLFFWSSPALSIRTSWYNFLLSSKS